MTLDERQLQRACRRAYERGRLRAAAGEALPVLPMVVLATYETGSGVLSLGLGLALAGLVVGARWRGDALAAGARAGLVAGALTLVIPSLYRACRHICIGSMCVSTCTLLCALVGAGAGVILGRLWASGASPGALLAGAVAASLAGAMGCLELGLGGLAAVLVGLAVAGAVTATAVPSPSARG